MSQQFLAIIKEMKRMAEEDKRQPPTACPVCGEPLQHGPRGLLNCPSGDYRTSGGGG